jgi:hypothetical protein
MTGIQENLSRYHFLIGRDYSLVSVLVNKPHALADVGRTEGTDMMKRQLLSSDKYLSICMSTVIKALTPSNS